MGLMLTTCTSTIRLPPPPERREVLKRTIDTWGKEAQQNIARLKVGIVGLGSVGCIVAEALARIGVSRITLIDHDVVKKHNLDRLLYATERISENERWIWLSGRYGTTPQPKMSRLLPYRCPSETGLLIRRPSTATSYSVALIVQSGRDVLNYISYAHLIPVIDGGVAIETMNDQLHSAHWRAHLIGPRNQCMRCLGQYNTSMVNDGVGRIAR